VAPLFDAYLMVDWSAASTPKRGEASIWIAEARRGETPAAPRNLPTRCEAAAHLEARIAARLAAGDRILLGWDFPLGYPAGTAAALGLDGRAWRALWTHLAEAVEDGDDNRNNRFALAAALNRRISGGAFPFWGLPVQHAEQDHLKRRRLRLHGETDLAERRLPERLARSAQPVWKLYGHGSVGSQAMLGIPVAERLRRRFAAESVVWPFETGLAAPARGARLVFAEIYPRLFEERPEDGEIRDAAQVRVTVRCLAEHDAAGTLAALFAPACDIDPAQRDAMVAEEGWILGVPACVRPGAPLRRWKEAGHALRLSA
jgi:hypothetical protein